LLVAHGLRRGNFGGLSLALLGGALVYRGVTGHCNAYEALDIDTSDKHRSDADEHVHKGRLIKHVATIDRPAADLYAFWRDEANAPRFMPNIESARKTGEKTSHWTSKRPMGRTFEWDSEIINEEPGRLLAWKSLPGGDVNNAGTVRFEPSTGGRGTVVTLQVNFEPPAGILGEAAARIIGEDPDTQARENLRRFKQLMETGVISTTEGQPAGRAATGPPDLGACVTTLAPMKQKEEKTENSNQQQT